MLGKKTISKALAYKVPTGKKGNKVRQGLKIDATRHSGDPSFLEEVLVLALVLRHKVNVSHQPAPVLADCPGYDGVCHSCDTCTCHEYF